MLEKIELNEHDRIKSDILFDFLKDVIREEAQSSACSYVTILHRMTIMADEAGIEEIGNFRNKVHLYLWERKFGLPFSVSKPDFIRK